MRGGHNKKSIEQHIQDGTFRADRHSKYLKRDDEEVLKEMKQELYNLFNKTIKKINKTNIDTEAETHKLLNDLLINQIKAYNAVAKTSVTEDESKKKNDKIDLAEFK